MPMNARENINGVTPQDLNKMNENFMSVWKTLYGGIDFDNTNVRTQNKINTQWITVQNEGNYDMGFPTYIRFYVPPDTKKIISSSFNFLKERYRMDSGVANGGGGVEDVNIAMSMGSATGGISSISSPTVSVSGGGGGATLKSLPVKRWATSTNEGGFNRPPRKLNSNGEIVYTTMTDDTGNKIMYYGDDAFGKGLVVSIGYMTNGSSVDYIDLLELQHVHEIDIPNHYHNITVQPHTHNVTVEPHTHNAIGKVSLPPHTHELNEGIKVSLKDAGATEIVLNGQTVGHMVEGLNSINDLDLTEFINIGEWNVMKISTNTLARITVYGVVEVIKS